MHSLKNAVQRYAFFFILQNYSSCFFFFCSFLQCFYLNNVYSIVFFENKIVPLH